MEPDNNNETIGDVADAAINDTSLASIPPPPSESPVDAAAEQEQQVPAAANNNDDTAKQSSSPAIIIETISIKDFARSLKLTSDDPPSATVRSFDNESFLSKCNRSSHRYDPSIHLATLASELFVKHQVWHSKDVLFDALSSFASVVGCKTIRSRDVIKLKSRHPAAADDNEMGLYVKLRALHNEKKSAAAPKDPRRSVPKARPVWEREVQIREVRTVLPVDSLKRKAYEMEMTAEDDLCPSAVFARGLKRMDGVNMMIVGFDEKTFEDKCMPFVVSSSDGTEVCNPNRDDRYDMDLMAGELFKRNDVWVNRDVLFHALSAFATVFGFKVVKSRYVIYLSVW